MNKKAALLTCFNRKEKTFNCLNSLFNILQDVDIYLVDDGSSDGTSKMVKEHFPQVNLIFGSGNLFWNRGMHLAWQYAAPKNYDFYLWINDDIVLYNNALDELMACSLICNHQGIISGVVEDESKMNVLYCGTDQKKQLVKPSGTMLPLYHMNGNLVLIPKYVYQKLGNLDPFFHHDLGDVDYGLRAIKINIPILSTRLAVASGTHNSISRLRLNNSNIFGRFVNLYSPLGNPPLINFYFRKKHYGLFNAVFYWFFLHFINIVPDKVNKFLFKNKYS